MERGNKEHPTHTLVSVKCGRALSKLPDWGNSGKILGGNCTPPPGAPFSLGDREYPIDLSLPSHRGNWAERAPGTHIFITEMQRAPLLRVKMMMGFQTYGQVGEHYFVVILGGEKERSVSQRMWTGVERWVGWGLREQRKKMHWKEMTLEGAMGGHHRSLLQRCHSDIFGRDSAQGRGLAQE